MDNVFIELKKIYEALYDDKSRHNFINRLSNNLSNDGKYILNIIRENCEEVKEYNISNYYDEVLGNADTCINKRTIVYGAHDSGLTRYQFNKYLIDNGVDSKNIIAHMNKGIQYFDYEYFKYSDEEVLVDAGCFDCGSIKAFIERVGCKYKKIYAFEPDENNYRKCINVIEKNNVSDIELIKAGCYDKETNLSFETNGTYGSSRIVENNEKANCSVHVVTIDAVCHKDKVTFIKMDIEGTELKALKGAKETIIKNKPKLAICIYHKDEDITEIQRYIMSIVPEYRFGIRHYQDHLYETVLYAFIEKEQSEK